MHQKLSSLLALVRFTPFDEQTEQGRSRERYRKAMLSILANVLSRAFGVFLTLLSVSLTLPYLGIERFGIWMTIASLAGFLTFLDLGMGNALTNYVADRAAKDDPDLLRQAISGGLGLLAVIGTCISLVLWLIAAHLPWGSILKVAQSELLAEARLAAMCFAVLFGITVFTSGIQNVFAGLQKAYIGHMISGVCSLVACLFLWLATGAQQGIAILLTIIMGAPILAGLILFGLLAAQKKISLLGIRQVASFESKYLFKAGGLFFILQIGTIIGWGMDSLLIASTLGVAQVAVFSIVQRLFMFASIPLSIINAPLWGAYADAHSRNERGFIRKTLKRSFAITFISTVCAAIVIYLFHSWLIKSWSRSDIEAPIAFVATYAIWTIIQSCGNSFAMFLNGTGIVKQQTVAVLLFIVIALPMKIILIKYFELFGLMLGTVVAYVISHLFVYCFLYFDDIKKNLHLPN